MMDELSRDHKDTVTELLRLRGGTALDHSLQRLHEFPTFWQEVDDRELQRAGTSHGPAAAGALYRAARAIVDDSDVTEEVFIVGTEVSAGEPAGPAELTEWRSAQRVLYGYAIRPWINLDHTLEFVRNYQEQLVKIAHLAVPRHRFWKQPAFGS